MTLTHKIVVTFEAPTLNQSIEESQEYFDSLNIDLELSLNYPEKEEEGEGEEGGGGDKDGVEESKSIYLPYHLYL